MSRQRDIKVLIKKLPKSSQNALGFLKLLSPVSLSFSYPSILYGLHVKVGRHFVAGVVVLAKKNISPNAIQAAFGWTIG
jgi:hypothetical protein